MNRSISDEILVKNILNGEPNAFTQLYERYRFLIYSAAFRVIGDPDEAQDATQEVFIKLYQSLHRWNIQKSKLSTWIYRMTVNHSIDCCRSRFRRAESQLPDYLLDTNTKSMFPARAKSSPDGSPFKILKSREEISLIRRYIKKLPKLQRKTFIGRYFRELTLVEIAEKECCNLGTVKSSLFRATHAVRRVLKESRELSFRKVELQA